MKRSTSQSMTLLVKMKMRKIRTERSGAPDLVAEVAPGTVATEEDIDAHLDLSLHAPCEVAPVPALVTGAERGAPLAPGADLEVDHGRRDGKESQGALVREAGPVPVPETGIETRDEEGGRGVGHVTTEARDPVHDHTREGGATVLVRGHVTVIVDPGMAAAGVVTG